MRFPLPPAHYIHVKPVWSLFLVLIVGAAGQTQKPASGESPAGGSPDPLILQVRVIEGEGMMYAAGGRATRGITVEVTDELGKPVGGATLSFRLPDQGPTGLFQNGTRTEIAASGPDGKASVWGMRWGKETGAVLVQITAAKGQTRAGTTVTQTISELSAIPVAQRKDPYQAQAHKRWVWISLVAAGAAGGGLALGARSTKAALLSTAPVTPLSIGRPTIAVGAP